MIVAIAGDHAGFDLKEHLADWLREREGVKVTDLGPSSNESVDYPDFAFTLCNEILSGRARGRQRIVSDGELLRVFRAFLLLAQRFCVDGEENEPRVVELEVNPFAFRQQRLVPLDGRRNC